VNAHHICTLGCASIYSYYCRLIDLRSGSVLTVRVTVTVTVTLVVSRSIKDFGVSTGAQASTVTLENFSQF
jgi:hypothetical protein